MSTRMTFGAELVARVKPLPGWTVRKTKDGFTVRAPNGSGTVGIHLSPSDVNQERQIMRELNALGFKESEAAWKKAEDRRKREAIETDRQRAEATAKTMAHRATMVSKAQGPYASELLDLTWALTPHPAPMCKKVILTPEAAEKLLDYNKNNRKQSTRTRNKYRAMLENGLYVTTHQGIAMDSQGRFGDGQHRAEAVKESGIPIEIFVFVGIDPKAFDVVDTGRRRSPADSLYRAGFSSESALSAMYRLVYLYNKVTFSAWNQTEVTNDMVLAGIKEDPDGYMAAVRAGSMTSTETGTIRSAACAGTYLVKAINPPDITEDFFEGLTYGAIADKADPRLAFRRYMLRSSGKLGGEKVRHRSSTEHLALIIKCWNVFNTGVGAREVLSWKKTEEFPRVSRRT